MVDVPTSRRRVAVAERPPFVDPHRRWPLHPGPTRRRAPYRRVHRPSSTPRRRRWSIRRRATPTKCRHIGHRLDQDNIDRPQSQPRPGRSATVSAKTRPHKAKTR